MKRKFINTEKLKNHISTEDEIDFMDSSLTQDIRLPPGRTVTFAIHGNMLVADIQGTAYVVRYDSSDTVLLNIDDYAFEGSATEEKVEVRGPLRTEHHHVDDLPSFLKAKAPGGVINRIEEIRQGDLTDSNFLKSESIEP